MRRLKVGGWRLFLSGGYKRTEWQGAKRAALRLAWMFTEDHSSPRGVRGRGRVWGIVAT